MSGGETVRRLWIGKMAENRVLWVYERRWNVRRLWIGEDGGEQSSVSATLTGCWERYLQLIKTGENCIPSSFMVCTLYQILCYLQDKVGGISKAQGEMIQ